MEPYLFFLSKHNEQASLKNGIVWPISGRPPEAKGTSCLVAEVFGKKLTTINTQNKMPNKAQLLVGIASQVNIMGDIEPSS